MCHVLCCVCQRCARGAATGEPFGASAEAMWLWLIAAWPTNENDCSVWGQPQMSHTEPVLSLGTVTLHIGNPQRNQTVPVLALSTAESELAAVTKGISEGMGAQAIFNDFGHINWICMCFQMPLRL